MFAQYSPLFNSGLMSTSPTSSRASSPKRRLRHHKQRDSLPVDPTTSSNYDAEERAQSQHNAFFTAFAPHRKDSAKEGQSFLSLDLTESNSMSPRRKDSSSSKRLTSPGRTEHTSPASPSKRFSFIPFLHPTPVSPAPSLRKSSRETLRLPSPKPAPSVSLPDPPPAPVPAEYHHRRSHVTPTTSVRRSDVPEAGPSSRRQSLPPKLKPSSSVRSTATSNSSRFRNRSAALAALEGRGADGEATQHRRQRKSRPRNFMSMSDDEDEEAETKSSSKKQGIQDKLLWVLNEEEDVVVPAPIASPTPSIREKRRGSMRESRGSISFDGVFSALQFLKDSPSSPRRGRTDSGTGTPRETTSSSSTPSSKSRRRSTVESFFSPITNFMDLRDDQSHRRSWRSFVEIPA